MVTLPADTSRQTQGMFTHRRGPEGRAVEKGRPWTGIEEWQERIVSEGQSPAPSPEAGVFTWTSFLCFVTDEPIARGCNAIGRQGRML